MLTSIVFASFSKNYTSKADSSLNFLINFDSIDEGTYLGWSYPNSIILSWHISLEHFKDITNDGTVPFLKKYFA